MKIILKLSLVTVILVVVSSCKNKTEKEIVSENETKENWIQLFNGKDLDGWTPKIRGYTLGDNIHNTFRVEDGVMKVSYDGYDKFNNAFGHIFYKTPYSDYRMRLKYRFTGNQIEGGEGWATRNSGIMIHCQPPESIGLDQKFPLCVEVQMLGGLVEGEDRPTASVCTPGTNIEMNGELITDHCITSSSKTYYGDQWVELEVLVRNDSVISHIINGETIMTYNKPQIGGGLKDFSPEWQAKDGLPLKGGYISLQSESHPVEFRNIELLEL